MDISEIKPCAEVIGADGVHIGAVDRVEGRRIKISRKDAIVATGRRYYVDVGLVADIENGVVRLSANGDVAILLEDEEGPDAQS